MITENGKELLAGVVMLVGIVLAVWKVLDIIFWLMDHLVLTV